MADGSRIHRNFDKFNSQLNNANTYFNTGTPTNGARIGILATELAQISAIVTQWNPLYAKYTDKRNSRTSAVIDQLTILQKKFIDLDHNICLLDRIASSPTSIVADLELFNIKTGMLRKRTRSVSTTVIDDIVTASITPKGGAQVAIKCRSVADGKATIIEGADVIQYCYCIGTTPPEAANLIGQMKESSSKASFTIRLDTTSAGKFLYIYFRWYNTKHPELAGPWSALQTTFII